MSSLIFMAFMSLQLPTLAGGNKAPQSEAPRPADDSEKEQVFCSMDVKECPDGSFVARDPEQNCNFKPCTGD